jgi:AraC family transcriptional regulator of adaptative response/methylated-DNA-[protein]-cysteine methyltransferase
VSKLVARDAHFWRAVLERDSRMDDAFVYAVRSTGVYCLPSCPSRRPRRAHVQFFRTAIQAQRFGYRPCRRCWTQRTARKTQREAVGELCRALDHATEPGHVLQTIRTAAARVGMSAGRLRRAFRELTGISPHAYCDQARLLRFKVHVRKEDVTTAMHESGYGSSSRLYERSNRRLGMTPATYGRGGRGMQIGYTISPSAAGHILVAGTDRGVCAVYLGHADSELLARLKREYPQAHIAQESRKVSAWVRQIVRHVAGRSPELKLPLDIQGTVFQRKVWDALLQIPYGETRTYTDIARQLGQAQARRAVARACATNPVSLVIPCHRVIRSDGGLGGYGGGGVTRKQALLDVEKRRAKKD